MQRTRINIMFRLIKLVKGLIIPMCFAILCGVLGALAVIATTTFGAVGILSNFGLNSQINIKTIGFIVLFAGLSRGLFKCLEQYFNHLIAFKILAIIRSKIFKKLRSLSFTKIDEKDKGDLMATLTADIETLEVFYAHTISPICIAFLTHLTVVILTCIYLSYITAIIYLLAQIIIGVVIPLIFNRVLEKEGKQYRKIFAKFNVFYTEGIRGLNEVILYNQKEKQLNEVNKQSNALVAQHRKILNKNTANILIVDFIIYLFIFLTVFLVGYISKDVASITIKIISTVLVFGSFGTSLSLSQLPGFLNQTYASANRVFDLLDEKPIVEKVSNKTDFVFDNLKLENIEFGYDKDLVLKNISLEINKGDIVGIKGESGCGKSTLLKLLLRFYDVNKGQVLYNGIDIKDINTQSLLDNISLFSQHTYLFKDTIKENLLMANRAATQEDIELACKKASIHDFIMSLEKGYETSLEAFSQNISAGEKQRIGLARVFLSDAKFLLLDEPTSNLDAINEGIILKSILKYKKGKTILLVSHRDSTLSICNKKYQIKNGELIE